MYAREDRVSFATRHFTHKIYDQRISGHKSLVISFINAASTKFPLVRSNFYSKIFSFFRSRRSRFHETVHHSIGRQWRFRRLDLFLMWMSSPLAEPAASSARKKLIIREETKKEKYLRWWYLASASIFLTFFMMMRSVSGRECKSHRAEREGNLKSCRQEFGEEFLCKTSHTLNAPRSMISSWTLLYTKWKAKSNESRRQYFTVLF